MTSKPVESQVWERKLGYRLRQFKTPGVYEFAVLMIVDAKGHRTYLLKAPSNARLEDLGAEDIQDGGGVSDPAAGSAGSRYDP